MRESTTPRAWSFATRFRAPVPWSTCSLSRGSKQRHCMVRFHQGTATKTSVASAIKKKERVFLSPRILPRADSTSPQSATSSTSTSPRQSQTTYTEQAEQVGLADLASSSHFTDNVTCQSFSKCKSRRRTWSRWPSPTAPSPDGPSKRWSSLAFPRKMSILERCRRT